MNKRTLALATLPLALATTTALAHPGSGFYLGATVGSVSVESDFDDINLDFDESDTAWSGFAGFQVNPMFGVEASYNNFGNFATENLFDLTRTEVDSDFTGFDVFGIVTVPIGPLSVFGKAGVVFWDSDATAIISPPVGSPFRFDQDDDGTDFAFGGGAEIALSDTLSVRGEVEWFDIDSTEEVLFTSVGLSFRF